MRRNIHEPRRIVLTGGPGAGKTATLEMIKQSFCEHVRVLPEVATIVFGGGFPRSVTTDGLKAAQRAIFYVQRELEAVAIAENAAIALCDRGTLDGVAYWPGPEELWSLVGTSRQAEMARYHTIIHLRTPSADAGYTTRIRCESNPLPKRPASTGESPRLGPATRTGSSSRAHRTFSRKRRASST